MYAEAVRSLALVERVLRAPLDDRALAAEIVRLQAHFWQKQMDRALMDMVAKDYVRLLKGINQKILSRVVDRILLDPAIEFCPKIGALAELAKNESAKLEYRALRLRAIISAAE